MKKITIALAMVAATMLTACSDPEEEAKEREAELAQQLTTETLSTYRGSPWSDSKSDVLKVYLKQNGVTESELDGFRKCLTEYANTKSTTLKTTEVLGWCLNEYKDIPEKFKSHIDLDPFFKLFSPWDGSFKPTEEAVLKTLNDPDSYKHDESSYTLHLNRKNEAPFAIVKTTFRAKNGFGAMMKASVTVRVDLKTMEMKIIEQQGI